ncbi:MAG: FAD-dependent oxidoreductase, partial [Pseudonocardia sp.]
MSVIVVGTGIAGVACAAELAAASVPVRILEQAGAVGGRMASPLLDGRPVDLGAAYFTVRHPEFAQVVARWRSAGLAHPWTEELTVIEGGTRTHAGGPVRWAAPGGLSSLVSQLAEGVHPELHREVRQVGAGPTVDGERADVVVLAMPDPQALRLVPPGSPAAVATAGRAWR